MTFQTWVMGKNDCAILCYVRWGSRKRINIGNEYGSLGNNSQLPSIVSTHLQGFHEQLFKWFLPLFLLNPWNTLPSPRRIRKKGDEDLQLMAKMCERFKNYPTIFVMYHKFIIAQLPVFCFLAAHPNTQGGPTNLANGYQFFE